MEAVKVVHGRGEKVGKHLRPDAYQEDYGRVRLQMPSEGKVLRTGLDSV